MHSGLSHSGPFPYELGGWGGLHPPNLGNSVFWAMTKIWAEGVYGKNIFCINHGSQNEEVAR